MRRSIASALLLAAAGLAVSAGGAQPPSRAAPIHTDMRNAALSTPARDVGVTARDGEMVVYGVIMDYSIDDATATVVTFVTGDASLYLSSGGGTIGGIGRPPVAAAARALVAAVSSAQLSGATRVTAFPRPDGGETRFYILTTQGVYVAIRTKAALEAGEDLYSPLYAAGHQVISRFMEADGTRATRN